MLPDSWEAVVLCLQMTEAFWFGLLFTFVVSRQGRREERTAPERRSPVVLLPITTQNRLVEKEGRAEPDPVSLFGGVPVPQSLPPTGGGGGELD